MYEFISASKRWHGLLSSLDDLRIISARLAPDLTPLVGLCVCLSFELCITFKGGRRCGILVIFV